MKCTILHESRGRMRVHVHAVRMTLHRADVLEAYLNHQDSIHHATVYERTGDVVLTYTGSRKEAIALLAGYKFDNAELDVLVTSNDSRKINREYQDKMFTLVAGHYARKLFLPAPIAAAYTIWRSIAFVWKGIRCLLQRSTGCTEHQRLHPAQRFQHRQLGDVPAEPGLPAGRVDPQKEPR